MLILSWLFHYYSCKKLRLVSDCIDTLPSIDTFASYAVVKETLCRQWRTIVHHVLIQIYHIFQPSKVYDALGNGNCLVYSREVVLRSSNTADFKPSYEALLCFINLEVKRNEDKCWRFLVNSNIDKDVKQYLFEKKYSSENGDIIINVENLCGGTHIQLQSIKWTHSNQIHRAKVTSYKWEYKVIENWGTLSAYRTRSLLNRFLDVLGCSRAWCACVRTRPCLTCLFAYVLGALTCSCVWSPHLLTFLRV